MTSGRQVEVWGASGDLSPPSISPRGQADARVRVRHRDRVWEVVLVRQRYVLGSDPAADIVLDDALVAPRHAELVVGPFGRWWLHDLGGPHGTWVAGEPIDRRLLSHGDRAVVGAHTVDFVLLTTRTSLAPPRAESRPLGDGDCALTVGGSNLGTRALPVSAAHLHEVGLIHRRLFEIDDDRQRVAALCRGLVDAGLPATTAAALRVRPDGTVLVLSNPARRQAAPEPDLDRAHRLLREVAHSRTPRLASDLDRFERDGDGDPLPRGEAYPRAAVACPLRVSGDRVDLLYVELPWRCGHEPWLALVSLLVGGYREAERVWRARRDSDAAAAVRHKLDTAREIQRGLLPDCDRIRGLDVAVGYEPSHWVGGDYVDAMTLPDGRIVLLIADVCGKGLGAALVSSSVHTLVRLLVADAAPVLVDLAGRLNRHLCTHLPDTSFVTFLAVLVDPRTGEVEYVNAGHPAPLLVVHGGPAEPLSAGRNLPVGMFAGATYTAERARMRPGDTLLLYTDGVSERFDVPGGEGEGHGEDELARALTACLATTARPACSALQQALSERLRARQGGLMPLDDATFLLARLVEG